MASRLIRYRCRRTLRIIVGWTALTETRTRLKILISNDDGYLAEGLAVLHRRLAPFGDIDVVAPDRNQSGASSSLTLHSPLRVANPAQNVWSVNGTPSDCVHLALAGFLAEDPDIVVSGIKHGANLGDDVIYSGTVAAAIEGRHLGLPALAVSLAGDTLDHFATAAEVTARVLKQLLNRPLPADLMLNINVPDIPLADLQGVQATRLGFRHRAEPLVRQTDPRGRDIYWIGPAGPEQDAGPGTDFHAVANGYASVTPLQIDLTRHHQLQDMRDWLEALR